MAHLGSYSVSRTGRRSCYLGKVGKPGSRSTTQEKQTWKKGGIERLNWNMNQNTSKLLSLNGHCNCPLHIPASYWREFKVRIPVSLTPFNKKKTQGSMPRVFFLLKVREAVRERQRDRCSMLWPCLHHEQGLCNSQSHGTAAQPRCGMWLPWISSLLKGVTLLPNLKVILQFM